MASKQKKRCSKAKRRHGRGMKKTRKQKGGDSASYGFGAAVAPGAPYAPEVIAKEACLATSRPGNIVDYSAGSGGLPGFRGVGGSMQNGGQNNENEENNGNMNHEEHNGNENENNYSAFGGQILNNSSDDTTQSGGRWMADPAQTTGGPNPMMPYTRIGCEGGMVDTSPPGAAANPSLLQAGGQPGGVASPFMQVPTAGYGNQASTWVSSTGTPSLVQTPYDARAMNPACLKTGGGSKRRGSKRRGSKRRASKRRG